MRIQSILIIFVARMERSVIRVSLANAEWVVSIINVKETRITLRCIQATVFDFYEIGELSLSYSVARMERSVIRVSLANAE